MLSVSLLAVEPRPDILKVLIQFCRNQSYRIQSLVFLAPLFVSFCVTAEEADLSNFLKTPFRVEEKWTLTLDGSNASSQIERTSRVHNRLAFVDLEHWRVKRDYPFVQSSKEILTEGTRIYRVTPSNRKILSRDHVSSKIYEEVILSPWRLAREWGMIDMKTSFEDWMASLPKVSSPMKNDRGDSLEIKTSPTSSNIQVMASGAIMQDGKTKVHIELTWELKDRGVVTASSLVASLVKE